MNARSGVALLLCALATWASAGTQVIGVELGATTLEQLKRDAVRRAPLEPAGTNRYSGGEMLRSDGRAHDIEGLSSILYIFDDRQRLAGVLLTMDKGRFDAVRQALAGKYKLVSEQRPFVGNQFARFKPGDAVIEVAAPHLSFEMEVRYLRDDLHQRFLSQSAAEAAARRKSEAEKF